MTFLGRTSFACAALGLLGFVTAGAYEPPEFGLIGGSTWLDEGRLFGSMQQSTSDFGASVAISGDRAIVGAPQTNIDGENQQGEAYVFRFENGMWTEEQRLVASDGDQQDFLGWSVALNGDTAFLGAFGEGEGTDFARGAVYVFERIGAVWIETQKLQSTDGDEQDRFGWAMDFDQGTLLVGARRSGPGKTTGGAAYTFVHDGSEWVEQGKLFDPLTEPSDAFGESVSLYGDRALVGASSDGDGTAYTFTRSGSFWSLEQKLEASDVSSPFLFGTSVALWGKVAAVGAPQKQVDGDERRGAAYIFRLEDGVWKEVQQLVGSSTHLDSKFGESLAMEGNTLLVDAEVDFMDQNRQGIVYEFLSDGSTWSELQSFRAPVGTGLDDFGEAIAFDQQRVIIGNSDNADLEGTAWVFIKPAIFEDGFESGTTTVWSNAVLGPEKKSP